MMGKLLRPSILQPHIILILASLITAGCAGEKPSDGTGEGAKVRVVATIFPLYDMAKAVGGDKVEVHMLLPPGVEAHTFEPRPSDAARIGQADLFFYAGAGMEPWAQSLIDGSENKKLVTINASSIATLIRAQQLPSGEVVEGNGVIDPHFWLDFTNDEKIADALSAALGELDPQDAQYFLQNAEAYKARLNALDGKYKETLKSCKKRGFITGGHNAFTYLADQYNLTGISAYGLSPDSEPTPRKIKEIDDLVKAKGIKYILFEDTVSPKVADAIAQGTGAKTLSFSPGENLPKADYDKNVSFLQLMENNLETLNIALECD